MTFFVTPQNIDVRAFTPLAMAPVPVPVPTTNNRKIETKIIEIKENDHGSDSNNTDTE